MKKNLHLRDATAVILGAIGAALMVQSFEPAKPLSQGGLKLALQKLNLGGASLARNKRSVTAQGGNFNTNAALAANAPTFGHPIIAGVGGTGFEESLRIDPTNPDRIYTSAPGSLSSDTSWVWHSLDGGRTFKWVVNAAPLTGKVTTCHGGGDSEIAVDLNGRLYFNDLTLVNFSTARSDDFGVTFTCSNTGVPETAVDRQWYAIDGDPLNGGSIYLVNDIIGPGAPLCGGSQGNNVLEMYRSPVTGLEPTAGIQFGPANHVSGLNTCNEGIMGNNEVSPVATTLGQPISPGVYATLAAPVKHIFVIHDNAFFNQIYIGRCFPVAFGAPVANVSDPSGLNCTDILLADLGANQKTGANFPTMAIDKAGTLYAVWEQAQLGPETNTVGDLAIHGDTVLKYSYSTDQGNTWSPPITIDTSGSPDGILHNNVFAWINAGDDGRVNIVWYGTNAVANEGSMFDFVGCGRNVLNPPPQGKNINGPDAADGLWSVWMAQSTNAHAATPTFTAPVRASSHHVHRGGVMTVIGGQCGWASRALGDYLQLRTGPKGEAHISYADSNNIVGTLAGHAMYVHQNGGTGLYAAQSPLSVSGITPFNGVFDQAGDGKYEVSGTSSANMPQLDILSSSISKVTTAPCSAVAPCYKVFMQLNDLSLAPTTAQDPDVDLVWHTQWFVPSSTDGAGGKNFYAYAESTNGGALNCFVGENAVQAVGGGGVLTYPGSTQLAPANCQSTLGPNGNITIYVPLSNVTEANAIDSRFHEVTASTMTLQAPASSVPRDSTTGFGGVFFNLIDVAQGYVFDPILVGAVSRKNHGSPGTFDIDLLPPASGIECRSGGSNGDFQIIASFALPVTFSSATVSGTGSVSAALASGNQVFVNLTGVTNAQRITLTLTGVNDGSHTANVSIQMGVLLGDVDASGRVDSTDVFQVRQQSLQNANSSNFRTDVDESGRIDSTDVFMTRQQTLTSLP
ncbi:MAG TPA: dockerin type I domain-containing protein [Chthoniobacterales bacterium]|nr:dockerin type I domain-containing protein [Chthoniobacterales bacterium]